LPDSATAALVIGAAGTDNLYMLAADRTDPVDAKKGRGEMPAIDLPFDRPRA
jgi:hypothetical protein